MNRKVLLGALALAGMLVISAPASAAFDDPVYTGDGLAIVLMDDVSGIGHAIETLPPSADGVLIKAVKFVLATGLDAVAPLALPVDRFAGLSPGDGDEPDSLTLMQMLKPADFGTTSRRYDPGWLRA